MNAYLAAVIKSIGLHGVQVTYTRVQEGNYNVETGSTTNTETTSSILAYPKNIKATQYNYPNLVGKEVVEYLVAGNALGFTPDLNDKITKGSSTYTVVGYTEHYAAGEVVLHKIMTVKG